MTEDVKGRRAAAEAVVEAYRRAKSLPPAGAQAPKAWGDAQRALEYYDGCCTDELTKTLLDTSDQAEKFQNDHLELTDLMLRSVGLLTCALATMLSNVKKSELDELTTLIKQSIMHEPESAFEDLLLMCGLDASEFIVTPPPAGKPKGGASDM